jgi:hypothetical protein
MKNLKQLWVIFEHFTYEQMQEKINEGNLYLKAGSENFPIEISDSFRFLRDFEKLFSCLAKSPKKYELVQKGKNLGMDELLEYPPEILFQGGSQGTKILRAEMRMILTEDNH